jgi:hypothetical protein
MCPGIDDRLIPENHDMFMTMNQMDCDGDGTPDGCEIAAGAQDCDQDHVPDGCEIVLPCQRDDGASEFHYGWPSGGAIAWLQRFGCGGLTTVSNIEVSWGTPAYPGSTPGNGTPAVVLLYDDPNDDGDPSDAVLVQQINTVVQNVDTDVFNSIPVSTTSMSGVFFVGAAMAFGPGQAVVPIDWSASNGDTAWIFGDDSGGPIDFTNPGANPLPPRTLQSIGFSAHVMIRAGCNLSPMTSFCLPGRGGVQVCPCANPPASSGLGCNNSSGTGGAALSGSGNASLSADTLVFTTNGERPTALSVVLQGTASLPSGVIYGQGIRCVGGTLRRLYVKAASGGSITAPSGGDLSVSARSAALGNVIGPGQNRYYLVYYRDPIVLGGCPPTSTFNSTQSGQVTWMP